MKLKFKYNIKDKVNKNDNPVPEYVLLGLILGDILGPFKMLPKIYAHVSLKKDKKIIV
jgi:hypothetical protein